MDTPIELLTQALLGELPEERKRCFEAWLQESEEHRLLWERFRQQGYFENTLSELHAVDAEGAFREFLRNRKRIRIRRVICGGPFTVCFLAGMGSPANLQDQ